MKPTALLPFIFLSMTALADTVNFDNAKPGAPPAGWTSTETGSGTAKWSMEKLQGGGQSRSLDEGGQRDAVR